MSAHEYLPLADLDSRYPAGSIVSLGGSSQVRLMEAREHFRRVQENRPNVDWPDRVVDQQGAFFHYAGGTFAAYVSIRTQGGQGSNCPADRIVSLVSLPEGAPRPHSGSTIHEFAAYFPVGSRMMLYGTERTLVPAAERIAQGAHLRSAGCESAGAFFNFDGNRYVAIARGEGQSHGDTFADACLAGEFLDCGRGR